jgi:hypothetical protein
LSVAAATLSGLSAGGIDNPFKRLQIALGSAYSGPDIERLPASYRPLPGTSLPAKKRS